MATIKGKSIAIIFRCDGGILSTNKPLMKRHEMIHVADGEGRAQKRKAIKVIKSLHVRNAVILRKPQQN